MRDVCCQAHCLTLPKCILDGWRPLGDIVPPGDNGNNEAWFKSIPEECPVLLNMESIHQDDPRLTIIPLHTPKLCSMQTSKALFHSFELCKFELHQTKGETNSKMKSLSPVRMTCPGIPKAMGDIWETPCLLQLEEGSCLQLPRRIQLRFYRLRVKFLAMQCMGP